MVSSAPKIDLDRLERKLAQQTNPQQRLLMLDHLIGRYVFTDINKAEDWLKEQNELLKHNYSDDLMVSFLLNSAYLENQRYNDKAAERFFQQALKIINDNGNARQIAEIWIDYAGTLINLDKYQQARNVLKKVERLLKSFPEESLQARMICREAYLYLHYNEYTKATDLFNQADSILNQIGNRLTLKDYYIKTLIHSGLGNVYQKGGDEGKGIASQRKVLQICEDNGLRNRLSWHYLNLGKSIMSLDKPKKAEQYFRRAIEHQDDNSKPARASALANLGYCLFRYENHIEALDIYNQATQAFSELPKPDYANLSTVENWRGQVYVEMGDPKLALKHFQQSYQYAKKTTDFSLLSSVFKQMANLYAELGDYKQAYEYQQYYDKAKEQHLDKMSRDKLAEMKVKYKAEERRQKAEMLDLEATKLQSKALRAQMNPHFVYNALNSIQNYITSNDTTSATKYLARFAWLMRQSLEYSDLEIISLEDEIGFLEDYLMINAKLRFEDRLQYKIHVSEEIEEDIMGVPTMIVQPYVENAIEHGLRTKKQGLVQVKFTLADEDTILCTVEDNGIGRRKTALLQDRDPRYENHKSKGTSITERRLEILHNIDKNNQLDALPLDEDNPQLLLEDKKRKKFVHIIDLFDADGEPSGTRVDISIPIVEIQFK